MSQLETDIIVVAAGPAGPAAGPEVPASWPDTPTGSCGSARPAGASRIRRFCRGLPVVSPVERPSFARAEDSFVGTVVYACGADQSLTEDNRDGQRASEPGLTRLGLHLDGRPGAHNGL